MKIDVKNQTPYRSNEDEGTSGTKPAAPGPKPRTYPPANTPAQAGSERGGDTGATDHAKAPPSDTGDTVSAKEKPGEPAKPQTNEDGTADANPGVPAQSSPSVPPPNGNTLQVKVAGIVNAVPPLTPSGSTPITGHTTKAGNVQRSNQAGYTAGNAGRSLTKGIGDAGDLAQSGNSDERTRYGLQLIKDLANGSASGIDLKRMTDKTTVAHEYLHGPRRKGTYNVEHGGHETPHRQQIELKSMRTLPTGEATQTLAISQSVAGEQVHPSESGKQTQAQTPANTQSSQTPPTPDTGAAQSNPVDTPASQEPGETSHTSEQVPGATSKSIELTKGVKENGHWVVADIGSLPADINNVKKHADLGSISAITSTSAVTAGDVLNVINSEGDRALALGAKSMSLLGTLVGLAPSVGQLANDVRQLIERPNDNQSKWNVANSGFELAGGLAAAAASMAFPPAALLPIIFPNLAEIGHAEILRQKKNGLYAEGLKVEGDATSNDYKIAALNATPIVNWFSSTYTPELRPAIEKFETEQGNKPGNPPAGDLPENTLHDQRVYDYYAQALNERAALLGNAANSYLKSIADNSTLSSVTMVSRCPQVFGWPSNGQAMRVFDRAAAITYDRVHNTIHTEFFGPDKDGTYRLPTRDPSLPSGKDSKNLLFCPTMLDPEAKRVDFDLPQYFADPGTVALDIRKQPNKT